MARIREWFPEFARHLVERSNRHDWPAPGSEYWLAFERSLHRLGVTWVQAEEALTVVTEKKGVFPGDWLPEILHEAKAIKRRDDEARLLGDATDRAELERNARDCPECRGAGWSPRFMHAVDHPKFPRGYHASGFCGTCRYGAHLAAANREKTWRDHPTLAYRPDLPELVAPDEWDAGAGRPVEVAAGKLPPGFARALAERYSTRTLSEPDDASSGTPGPLPPSLKTWRRDDPHPGGKVPGKPDRPPTAEPPKHREPPPF